MARLREIERGIDFASRVGEGDDVIGEIGENTPDQDSDNPQGFHSYSVFVGDCVVRP